MFFDGHRAPFSGQLAPVSKATTTFCTYPEHTPSWSPGRTVGAPVDHGHFHKRQCPQTGLAFTTRRYRRCQQAICLVGNVMNDLIDCAKLTATQYHSLALLSHRAVNRMRGCYRLVGGGGTISLKTIERLETLGLVRERIAGGRKNLVLTGTGRQLLAVLDARKSASRQGPIEPKLRIWPSWPMIFKGTVEECRYCAGFACAAHKRSFVQQFFSVSANRHLGRAQTCCKAACSLCVP